MLRYARKKASRLLLSASLSVDLENYRDRIFWDMPKTGNAIPAWFKSLAFWLSLVLTVCFLWYVFARFGLYFAKALLPGEIINISNAGTWCDTFGAFNSLVSAFGAILVISTLRLQQSSITDQRKALALQNADSHKQRFESTFFELLRIQKELRNELYFTHSEEFIFSEKDPHLRKALIDEKRGVEALNSFVRELLAAIRKMVVNPLDADHKQIGQAYDEVLRLATDLTFAPYFRLIYTILAKIKNDKILSEDEKFSYARLLRSQLNHTEVITLAYNALSDRAADLFDLLVEYRMLKYMPDAQAKTRFQRIYPREAFSARD